MTKKTLKEVQSSLFDEENSAEQTKQNEFGLLDPISLVHIPQNVKEKKIIKDYNGRLLKFKKLKVAYFNLKNELDILNQKFHRECGEVRAENGKAHYELLVKIDSFYKMKGLTKYENQIIYDFVSRKADWLQTEYDINCSDIIGKYIETELAENEGVEDELLDFFGDNLPPDFDIREFYKLSQEELLEKYGAFFRDKFLNEKTEAEISNKQENKYDEDLKELYKKLSKEIHPDLEKDPIERLRKEELMKELNEGRNNKDIYKLLSVQAEISSEPINIGESGLYTLAKIKGYSARILEQIQQLERKIWELKNRDPKNSFLYNNFYHKSADVEKKNIRKYKIELAENTKFIKKEIKELNSKKAVKLFLKDIADYFEEQEFDFFADEDFDDL